MFKLMQGQHNTWSSSCGGFTLVEVLIVVAILAVVVAAMVGAGMAINTQRDTALTQNCLDVLDAALAEFRSITGHYPVNDWSDKDDPGSLIDGASSPGIPAPDEVLYLQLSILPQTRAIISKLPSQLIIEPLSSATVTIGGETTPYLQSIVDAWHTENDTRPLHYDQNDPNFPYIWSDGPNGVDDTRGEDDISNED